ncbi:MAG TPA: hypothetical protein VLI54_02295 [Bacillota bacterium]|nr:hypothetical protein [Bacillota bacterium]
MAIFDPTTEAVPPLPMPDFGMDAPTEELPILVPYSYDLYEDYDFAPPEERVPLTRTGEELRAARRGHSATAASIRPGEDVSPPWYGNDPVVGAIVARVNSETRARDLGEVQGPHPPLKAGKLRRDLREQGVLDGLGFWARRRAVQAALCTIVEHGTLVQRPEGYMPKRRAFTDYHRREALE